jgi:hypothetical protein
MPYAVCHTAPMERPRPDYRVLPRRIHPDERVESQPQPAPPDQGPPDAEVIRTLAYS